MACAPTVRTIFIPVSRHSASTTSPRLIVSSTRSFHTSRWTLNSFNDILSKSKIPAGNVTEGGDVLREFDNIFTQSFSPHESSKDLYHLHIYSTKHNTHITFTDPKKNPIISVSAGNLGFKKAQRGTYDAAYQLASHVFAKLEEKPIRPKALEVVLRDFGEGREAVVKALLGTEGRNLKGAITRVTDATRLKFGGTRSKAPRRLVGELFYLVACDIGGLTSPGFRVKCWGLLEMGRGWEFAIRMRLDLVAQWGCGAANACAGFGGMEGGFVHCIAARRVEYMYVV
ncbi:hypothetical protein BGX38DRAFT_312244 [Terfezia claveryi]|nr:hypothetical protein BGX38DRAFT_312244 [Terfezia claveryi]